MKKLCICLAVLVLGAPATALAHGQHTHSRHHHSKHHVAQHYVHHHKYRALRARAHKADVEGEPNWLEWREECVAEGLERDWCYEGAEGIREEEEINISLTPLQQAEREACDSAAVTNGWEAWYCEGSKPVILESG